MTTASDDCEALGVHIGRNAQRLRDASGISRDELAQLGKQLTGAAWTASRIGTIETGTGTPGLPTLLAYCAALNFARMVNHLEPIGLPDFFEPGFKIAITDRFTIGSTELKAAFGGSPVRAQGQPASMDEIIAKVTAIGQTFHEAIPDDSRLPPRFQTVQARNGLAFAARSASGGDKRAAKSLGWNIYELSAWSWQLWRRTFSQERDERAGAEASPQRRGIVSRELMAELKAAMTAYEAED